MQRMLEALVYAVLVVPLAAGALLAYIADVAYDAASRRAGSISCVSEGAA